MYYIYFVRQFQNSVSDKLVNIDGVMFDQWILIYIVGSIRRNEAEQILFFRSEIGCYL